MQFVYLPDESGVPHERSAVSWWWQCLPTARSELPSLTLFRGAPILPSMSIDDNLCLVACAMAGFRFPPAFSPAAIAAAAANDRNPFHRPG
jgi:hypothetical protein